MHHQIVMFRYMAISIYRVSYRILYPATKMGEYIISVVQLELWTN